ncbi:flagellin [Priestia megaterium]|uniref:flagellin N-terminal helical domain-containing protein n=1 Tax=Priestia megaterium TaxID=1404 RepID=UPI000D51F400|nr:flagellin [Priestia megaterium]PVE67219.1 flagellin [Priestia megaterium]PVE84255.1 flagellin [Priestia megaterium]PVE91358.1 flagellin [Priestia megaterium]PVE94445.1 flagellin [Priestia megaterium]
MRINHNIAALNTYRQFNNANNAQGKSMEKLSSGLRINSAADDAAGLAISEKMRGQVRGLEMASKNAQDGVSLIQTAEGALNETHDILQRMRELTVQAGNETNTTGDLDSIQKEISELNDEVDRIANKTDFNTKNLLDGSLGVKATGGTASAAMGTDGIEISTKGIATGKTITLNVDEATNKITATLDGVSQTITADATLATGSDVNTMKAGATLNFDSLGLSLKMGGATDFSAAKYDAKTLTTSGNSAEIQIGANKNTTLSLSISDMSTTGLGTGTATGIADLGDVNVKTQTFNNNIQVIDKAIEQVSTQRSQLGAWQNRLEHTINNLSTSSENLTAAESRVRDVDYALAA